MENKLKNKLKLFLLFSTISIVSLNTPIILANEHEIVEEQDTEETKELQNFTKGSIRFSNKSFKESAPVTVTSEDGETTETMTAKDFINRAVSNPDEAKKVFESNDVWLKINLDKSAEMGTPVFYMNDTDPKNENTWKTTGDPEGNDLVEHYFELVEKHTNGLLSSGNYSTVVLYDKMPGIIGSQNKKPKQAISLSYCDPKDKPQYVFAENERNTYSELTGPYSVYLRVEPVKPKGFEKLSKDEQNAWIKTHHTQVSEPILTPFGEAISKHTGLIDKLEKASKKGDNNEEYKRLWKDLEFLANKEIPKDITAINLNFTDLNREGFGHGGAYTVIESVKYVTIRTSNSQDLYDQYECVTKNSTHYTYTEDKETNTFKLDEATTTYNVLEKTKSRALKDEYEDSYLKFDYTNYKPLKSYQVLNVRCNLDGFESVVEKTKSQVQTFGNGKASNTSVSPTVSNKIANYYNDLDTDFFYKGDSCKQIYSCTSDPIYLERQGGSSNVRDENKSTETTWGAVNNQRNSSVFYFKNDGRTNSITTDFWGLALKDKNKNDSLKGYPESISGPDATVLTFDPQSTPNTESFSIVDSSNNELYNGELIRSKNGTVLDKLVNNFQFKSTWPSDSERPLKINISYGYNIYFDNRSITSLSNTGVNFAEKPDSYGMTVFCDTHYNTLDDVEPRFINKPFVTSIQPNYDFNDSENVYLTVEFSK